MPKCKNCLNYKTKIVTTDIQLFDILTKNSIEPLQNIENNILKNIDKYGKCRIYYCVVKKLLTKTMINKDIECDKFNNFK